jgi:type IV secretory pathway VirB10-like protein
LSTRAVLLAALPFVLTALVTIVVTLSIQAAITARQDRALPAPAATQEALPAPTVSTAPLAPPLAVPPPTSEEVTELRSEVNRLWSALYLARAANQLADAEAALRVNNLDEVEQVLATVSASLEQAYERSAEQEKGPISEFRTQVSRMYSDLRVRPEGMDQRLRRLRQSMLTLMDESG